MRPKLTLSSVGWPKQQKQTKAERKGAFCWVGWFRSMGGGVVWREQNAFILVISIWSIFFSYPMGPQQIGPTSLDIASQV